MRRFAQNYYFILIAALIIGFLIVAPTIVAFYKGGINNFKGIYPDFNDDEIHYLAMTKEVSEGHVNLGNVFLNSYKNGPYMQPPLAEIIFAKAAGIFNISVPAMFVINDFVLPFLGVIALYFLFLNITGLRRASAVFSFLFYLLFIFSFGRPVNPQFGFIFLVLGLLLIWKVYSNEKVSIKHNLLLGLVFGILVYIYPYFWTALLVVYGLSLLIKIKEWGIINSIKSFFIFAPVAGVISAPYLINQYNAIRSPFYGETTLRLGMLNIHLPGAYFNVGLLILALLALYLALGREYQFREVRPPDIAQFGEVEPPNVLFKFCLVLLLSGLILNWQNIITGKYLQFSSHYYMVSVLFVFIALAAVFSQLFRHCERPQEAKQSRGTSSGLLRRPAPYGAGLLAMTGKAKGTASIFIVLAIFSVILYRQSNEIKTQMALLSGVPRQEFIKQQGVADVFDWFNKNSAPDSVILSLSNKYSNFLPIYTRNNLYSYGYAASYLMPDSELEDRWVRQNIFNENVDAEYIAEHHREIYINKFIDRYQNEMVRQKIIGKLFGKKIAEPEVVPQEYINRVLEKHREVKKEDPRVALKKYQIDYILLDLNDSVSGGLVSKLDEYEFIEPVIKINNVLICRVN